MPTAIDRSVEAARAGVNPSVIARCESGWMFLSFYQQLKGYCVLMPDPVVPTLNSLQGDARFKFLHDMCALGDVLLELTGAARINYEILGNLEPALHAHVIPRYTAEPDEFRTKPVWFYPWMNSKTEFDQPAHAQFMQQIRDRLWANGVAR